MEIKQEGKDSIKEINERVDIEAKRLINSFKYAGTGIITSLKKEKNMKIHFFAMILVIVLGIIFKISLTEWIICIILFAGVIGGEMFNTAVETVVDIAMPYKNEKAKIAKDVAAGGVLVWAICSAIIGGLIFVPKILSLF